MRKFQFDNPNNSRVYVDFNNKKSPVRFEYVGDSSAFMVCYTFFKNKFHFYVFPFVIFLMGMLSGVFYKTTLLKPDFLLILLFLIFELVILTQAFPIILAFIFSKSKPLLRTMPYLWGYGKTEYIAEFTPLEVVNNKVEIPWFKNTFIKYELEGDFLKYIDKIEVVEHPFNRIVRKGFSKRVLKRNEHYWKATFYFKEKPKTGSLKTRFC